jgi:hypothetical protein
MINKMNRMQVQQTEENQIYNIIGITQREWTTLVQNSKEDIQPLLDFEWYIIRETKDLPSDMSKPCFDLSYLTLYMSELAKSLDLDLFKMIEQFNIHLDYEIVDNKITMKEIIEDTLQINLDNLDHPSLLRLDNEGEVYLSSSTIENIILRYYYFQAFPNSLIEASLNLSTRKLLFADFNELLYDILPIESLITLLNSSYKTVDRKKLSLALYKTRNIE